MVWEHSLLKVYMTSKRELVDDTHVEREGPPPPPKPEPQPLSESRDDFLDRWLAAKSEDSPPESTAEPRKRPTPQRYHPDKYASPPPPPSEPDTTAMARLKSAWREATGKPAAAPDNPAPVSRQGQTRPPKRRPGSPPMGPPPPRPPRPESRPLSELMRPLQLDPPVEVKLPDHKATHYRVYGTFYNVVAEHYVFRTPVAEILNEPYKITYDSTYIKKVGTPTELPDEPSEDDVWLSSKWHRQRFPDTEPSTPDQLVIEAQSIVGQDGWESYAVETTFGLATQSNRDDPPTATWVVRTFMLKRQRKEHRNG